MKYPHSLSIIGILLAIAVPRAAHADDFPSRPLRVLVGFAPGGNVGTATRIVARKLDSLLGVAVVLENKPGQELSDFIQRDIARWKKVVREAGITPE